MAESYAASAATRLRRTVPPATQRKARTFNQGSSRATAERLSIPPTGLPPDGRTRDSGTTRDSSSTTIMRRAAVEILEAPQNSNALLRQSRVADLQNSCVLVHGTRMATGKAAARP